MAEVMLAIGYIGAHRSDWAGVGSMAEVMHTFVWLAIGCLALSSAFALLRVGNEAVLDFRERRARHRRREEAERQELRDRGHPHHRGGH